MEPFPEDVRSFLEANIDSVVQLEILRLLADNPGVEYDSDYLAEEVQVPHGEIGKHLAALERRGLLTIIREPCVSYRHGAHTAELAEGLAHLLHLYNERPVTMIRMAYARANSLVRAFRDGVRRRKEN